MTRSIFINEAFFFSYEAAIGRWKKSEQEKPRGEGEAELVPIPAHVLNACIRGTGLVARSDALCIFRILSFFRSSVPTGGRRVTRDAAWPLVVFIHRQ